MTAASCYYDFLWFIFRPLLPGVLTLATDSTTRAAGSITVPVAVTLLILISKGTSHREPKDARSKGRKAVGFTSRAVWIPNPSAVMGSWHQLANLVGDPISRWAEQASPQGSNPLTPTAMGSRGLQSCIAWGQSCSKFPC